MKRFFSFLLALILLAALWSFAEEDSSSSTLDIALGASQKLVKLISMENYVNLLSSPGEIASAVLSYGGDWAAPERLMDNSTVFIPKLLFSTALSAYSLGSGKSLELVPYTDHLMQLLAQTPVGFLNGQGGSTALAVSSVARYSELRCLPDMMPGVTYVLLDYGQEHPFILVTFVVADDGAASVSATILTAERETVDGFLKRFSTLEGLKELLSER